MNIVVEGPRGVGKTTYIQNNIKPHEKIFKDMSYYFVISSGLDNNFEKINDIMIGKDIAFLQSMKYMNNVWHDRLFFSNIVYSVVYRNQDYDTMVELYKKMIQLADKNSYKVLFLLHTNKSIQRYFKSERFVNELNKNVVRGDGFKDSFKNIRKENDIYKRITKSFSGLIDMEVILCAE